MVMNVEYIGTQGQVSPLCPKNSISGASPYIHYQCLHVKLFRVVRQEIEYINVLFIIPVTVDLHCHRFKIYTLI